MFHLDLTGKREPIILTTQRRADLHKNIKFSNTHSLGILSRSFPLSAEARDVTRKGVVPVATKTNAVSSNGLWCIVFSTTSEMDSRHVWDRVYDPGNLDRFAI